MKIICDICGNPVETTASWYLSPSWSMGWRPYHCCSRECLAEAISREGIGIRTNTRRLVTMAKWLTAINIALAVFQLLLRLLWPR